MQGNEIQFAFLQWYDPEIPRSQLEVPNVELESPIAQSAVPQVRRRITEKILRLCRIPDNSETCMGENSIGGEVNGASEATLAETTIV